MIRDWQPSDRAVTAAMIQTVLAKHGLSWEPMGADRDVLEVEADYLANGGEFWVVAIADQVVGSIAYYPILRNPQAVEIRKMYLLPTARGKGLGRFLL